MLQQGLQRLLDIALLQQPPHAHLVAALREGLLTLPLQEEVEAQREGVEVLPVGIGGIPTPAMRDQAQESISIILPSTHYDSGCGYIIHL